MSKVTVLWQKTNKLLRDNLFPENFRCHICDVEIFEGELCADCAKRLVINSGTTCPKCGRKTAKNDICIECKANMPAYDRALSPLVYDGGSADLIGRFKCGRPYIARYLSKLIAEKIKELPAADGIVFVPMTERAVYQRGYNQSELLAKEVSELTGMPVLYGVAEKIKDTPPQKNLPRQKRLKNLSEAFRVQKKAVKGKSVLLIDDIMTTGATLESLSLCLKKAGAWAVYAVVAASVEYK